MGRTASSSSSSSAFSVTSPSSWWRVLSPSALLSALLPSAASSPLERLERLLLAPLELYESLVILPVGLLRRHMPVLGGALVVLMTLHGLLLRLLLDGVRLLFARITFSRDARANYDAFWRGVQARNAFPSADWRAVHRVFGAPLSSATCDDDLWLALQESVALCGDPALRVSRPLAPSPHHAGVATLTAFGRAPLTAQRLQYEAAAMAVVRARHLTDGGRAAANHLVYGILNAETSPGWRIGYLAIHAMDGFVDFPLPRLDALGPLFGPEPATTSSSSLKATSARTSTTTAATTTKNVAVPEIYDLESMRWALEAVLRSLGDVDALILDLRFNRGGGSLAAALAVASFFTGPKQTVAFQTDEKTAGARFTKKRKHYVARSSRALRYSGPMVVLQSQYTRGTAEILSLSLMQRANTTRIGAPSAGSLTQTRRLRLPNCWTVDIPYMRCFSSDGKELYEGRGVPVDKTVENMEDAVLRARPLVTATSTGSSIAHDVFDPCIKTAIDHIMKV